MKKSLIIIFLFVCLTIQAANYYVSGTGNDAAAGTIGAPWLTPAKANTYSFSPGDSLLFKAGDSFSGPLNIDHSGTVNSPIVVGRYGTGDDPIIYGDHPGVVWSAVAGHAGVYSSPMYSATLQNVFDTTGIKYTKRTQGADDLDTWLGKFTASEWGFTFTPAMVYIRTTDDNPPPYMHLFEWSTVKASSAGDYVTFEHLDVRNGYIGIISSYATGTIIKNCNAQDVFNAGIFFLYADHGEAHDNTVTRSGETSIYLQNGGWHWIHHNTVYYTLRTILGCTVPNTHPECCGIGLQQGQNNLIEHNSIYYMFGAIIDYWVEVNTVVRYNYGFHSKGGAYPEGTGLQLYYNIFDLDSTGGGISAAHDYDPVNSPAADTGPIYVYNNTVYNPISYGLLFTPGGSDVVMRNNMVVTTSNLIALVENGTGLDTDNNLYYNTTGDPKGWYWNTVKYTILGAYQTASSQEANSLYGDPLFVSESTGSASNFMIQSGSPAINTGIGVGLTTDYSGHLIQGLPDIGAYEWGSRRIVMINGKIAKANGKIVMVNQ